MGFPHGTYLGGIRVVEDLRQRCRIDNETGCWHWSLNLLDDGSPRVHFVLDGKKYTARGRSAALILKYRRPLPKGHVAFANANCKSDDCVNPDHARSASRREHGEYLKSTGKSKTFKKKIACINTARSKLAKITMQIAREIRLSNDSTYKIAAKYGISQSVAWSIKAGRIWKEHEHQASVFTWKGIP